VRQKGSERVREGLGLRIYSSIIINTYKYHICRSTSFHV
jgi:hypothetical protein